MAVAEPGVTVVLLNWNGGSDVIGCLEHVCAQTHPDIEVIVVDNGSTDDSVETMRRRFPGINMVENGENLGFAEGMNRGIQIARGRHLLLLNQDAWIRHDFIGGAVEAMNSAPDVGMIACRVYKLDRGLKTDQVTGGGLLLNRRLQLTADPDVSSSHHTFSPTWCCPFLRRQALDDVRASSGHVFDGRYFAFGEDLDLALRLQLRGWKCLFTPEVVAWHAHSGSLGGQVRLWQKPPAFRTHTLRNRYLTILKDLPAPLLAYLVPFLAVAEVAAWPFFLVKSPRTLRCLLRAYGEAICMLPESLRMRHRIQATRRVAASYLTQFFVGF